MKVLQIAEWVEAKRYVLLPTGPVSRELAIQHIAGDDRALAMVLGQTTTAWPGS